MLNRTFQGHFLTETNTKAYSYKGKGKELKLLLRLVNTGSYKTMPTKLGNESIRLALRVKLRDQSRAEQKYAELPQRDRMTPRLPGID